MPEHTIRNGGKIVIVNNMATPMDGKATLHFDDLGTVFEQLKIMLTSADY